MKELREAEVAMPDGDIVHSRLERRYHRPYKWLCEGAATSDECAQVLLKSLKQDIKSKGDLSIMLSQSMADSVSQIMDSSAATKEDNFTRLSREFDKRVQEVDGSPYVKELMSRAGKIYLNDLRNGREEDIIHASEGIWVRYAREVYEAAFKERIPLTSEHHAGVAPAVLEKRIESMEASINAGIHKFAKDAIKNQSVTRLTLPRSCSRKVIDLNEDLLAG